MKKIVSLLTVLSLVSAVSCTSMLEIEQHGNVSTLEDFYKTDEEVESAVAAMYAQFRDIHLQVFYTLSCLDGDTWTGGLSRGQNPNMEKLNEYTFDASHEWMKTCYTDFYKLIYKASLITEHVEGDSQVMKQAVNEALVMRALANFYLVTMWGTAPLVDHVLKPSEYRVSNATPEQFWTAIETDLNEAINSGYLRSKTGLTDRNTGVRITKEFAYALLGKSYLWQKKYAESVAAFDKVIGSGLYGLYGVAEPGEYDELLHANANNCCESLLEAQWRNDPAIIFNQRTTLWASLSLRNNIFTVNNGYTITGWGFLNPTKDLYDAFVAEEGVDGYRLNCTVKTPAKLEEAGIHLNSVQDYVGNEGYFGWKYSASKAEEARTMPVPICLYRNWRLMRYAEVLLCAAEANLLAGNQQKADDYVNQIRSRAKLAPKSGVSLEDIKTEKRLELCIENVRFLDLKRWGDAQAVLAEQGHYVPSFTYDAETGVSTVNPHAVTNTVYGFKSKHMYLPIPATEIDVNPNIVQNEGW